MAGVELPDGYFSVQQAADMVGLNAETLRRWDRKGLVTPQRLSFGKREYRAYTNADITKIRALIRMDHERRAQHHIAKAQEYFALARGYDAPRPAFDIHNRYTEGQKSSRGIKDACDILATQNDGRTAEIIIVLPFGPK